MRIRNLLLPLVSSLACGIFALVFLAIIGSILLEAGESLNWSFLTDFSMDSGREGGILEVIVSSSLILLIALALALPLSLATSVFLVAFSNRTSKRTSYCSKVIRISLDTLAATPSIVFGLFGYSFFVVFLGLGFSIASGGLTLACMILPFLIRLFEQGISKVHEENKLASASLGISKSSMVKSIVLPLSGSAITAGLVLSIGRALSETAALLFTSGYVLRMPESLLDSGRTMSVHIYDLSMNVPGGNENAYKTAFVLVIFLLLINFLASFLTKKLLQPG